MAKLSKTKKTANPVGDGKSCMRDSFRAKYFEPNEINTETLSNENGTTNTDEAGQLYCLEIQSSSSASVINSKCLKYETCKKKAAGLCCRGYV